MSLIFKFLFFFVTCKIILREFRKVKLIGSEGDQSDNERRGVRDSERKRGDENKSKKEAGQRPTIHAPQTIHIL